MARLKQADGAGKGKGKGEGKGEGTRKGKAGSDGGSEGVGGSEAAETGVSFSMSPWPMSWDASLVGQAGQLSAGPPARCTPAMRLKMTNGVTNGG